MVDFLFVDGNKISEFTAGDNLPLQWIIGAFNDNGQPFSAYVDDVRVLRKKDLILTPLETAPSSIAGYEIHWTPELEGEESVWTYHANGTVTINGRGEEPFEYEYEKISESTGKLYYPSGSGSNGNGLPEEDTLTFSASGEGNYDYEWVRYSDASKSEIVDQENGKFSIKQKIPPIILETAPSTIAGKSITYTEGVESETATFPMMEKYGDMKSGHYTYEKISGNVGKVIYTFENEPNPMPEVEILTFTSNESGTFEWSEFSDSTMSTKVDSGSGTFSLTTSDNQTGAPIYLLNDNQFMHLTGMLWSETESKAPDALIFDNYFGHFAIVPNPYFEEESNGDLTVMPLHSHLLLPVIQQADGDWVEEISDFDGLEVCMVLNMWKLSLDYLQLVTFMRMNPSMNSLKKSLFQVVS